MNRLAAMPRLPGTVAFRLALGYGLLIIGSMAVVALLFYVGTVGVLSEGINDKLKATAGRLTRYQQLHGSIELRREIQRLLDDGVDSDTEVYFFAEPDGTKIAGNLAFLPPDMQFDRLTDLRVTRAGRDSVSRLLPYRLPTGEILVVGRDQEDQRKVEFLVWQSLAISGALALLMGIGGALLFRRQIEHRIAAIRRTAAKIETGDLSWRIPKAANEDEFSRLDRDINQMLDRIQHLMDGVRHVSNSIAHDLRSPLGRIRTQLEAAARPGKSLEQVSMAARTAIGGIDDLIAIFEKLLQIAEAEAGNQRQSFLPVALGPILTDIVELYDAMAEDKGIALGIEIEGEPTTLGDRDLLAGAIANLVDNALKYAGSGAAVLVKATTNGNTISIVVRDNGPGISADERAKVIDRFYRSASSRGKPGNGLGLSLVRAVIALHGGRFRLDDAAPGLIADIALPRAEASSAQHDEMLADRLAH
jgi:signal transduction histidine kinase